MYGDGRQVRDWLHVEDHCKAIGLALTQGKPGEVYNIGGNSETANIDIVRALCGLLDEHLTAHAKAQRAFPDSPGALGRRAEELVTYVRDRPGHDRRYAIDYRKAERDLGYTPGRNLAQGLRETLDWYLSNASWWQALLGSQYSAWIEKNYKRQ